MADQWPRLRRATNADCSEIAELVFTILREYELRPDPESTDVDLKDIERSYFGLGVRAQRRGSCSGPGRA